MARNSAVRLRSVSGGAVRYLSTEDVPLSELREFPGNPRVGDMAVIRKSLAMFGQYRSLAVRVLSDGSRVILAGNHTARGIRGLVEWAPGRIAAEYGEAAAERWSGAPATARCDLVECGDDEAKQINAADNRLAELGSNDLPLLADLLGSLEGTAAGLPPGWDDDSYAALQRHLAALAMTGDEVDSWEGMPEVDQPGEAAAV